MLLNKYNKKVNVFKYEQVENPEYKNLKELFEDGKTEILIKGLFINTKGYYGDSPVAIAEGYNINLPGHLLDTVKEMLTDSELIEMINNDRVGINIYQYTSKKWGSNYSVNFIEM
mgnify:FL=1